MKYLQRCLLYTWVVCLAAPPAAMAQSLEDELKSAGAAHLVKAARELGDAQRGAVVFYQPQLACTRCHIPDKETGLLGPDLTKLGKDASDVHLVESILEPSKVIRQGFEPATVITTDGTVATGILVSSNDKEVTIRDAGQNFKVVKFDKAQLASLEKSQVSIMPAGQINLLTSRQQFLDLIRYLIEIRDGGSARAHELEPAPSLYAARPLPEYEQRVDHAGIIASLDRDAFTRGERIYDRLCVNCHGTQDRPGSLPTSLKFASDRFKNGSDPFTMYQTLTKGFGLMVAQTWMVPTQKYDVIHYIREAYLKDHNPSQHHRIDKSYLDRLPKGDTRGPPPSDIRLWEQMDYGPNLVMTLEIGNDATNFAYKGNAIRLDAGPGGVSQGRYWMVFDYDTLRVAAAWSGKGFCDWRGINFDGRHNIHPRLVGDIHLANPTGPGWGRPEDGSFEDVRLVGRDHRIYGPLPRKWAHYKGMYYHGPRTLIEYTVGDSRVLEMPGVLTSTPVPVFTRAFNIGPRDKDLVLQVAHRDEPGSRLVMTDGAVLFGVPVEAGTKPSSAARRGVRFNGGTYLEAAHSERIDLHRSDFTVTARIKTKKDGTILARTEDEDDWHANGMAWFIRDGRLTLDIGWVGAFRGRRRVNDGKWHDVAFAYENRTGAIQFYVDGRPERRQGRLKPEKPIENPVVRIGYTSANFPEDSAFDGDISEVRVYKRVLGPDEVKAIVASGETEVTGDLMARWDMDAAVDGVVPDKSGNKHDCKVVVGEAAPSGSRPRGWTVAGVAGRAGAVQWLTDAGNLRLRIPAGDEPLRFTLWFAMAENRDRVKPLVDAIVFDEPDQDLRAFTKGGPSRWPQVLTTEAVLGDDDGPFAVDVLTQPTDNPWFCRMRFTGLDFLPGGDQMVVSAWEGSIWLVSGLGQLPTSLPETSATGDARKVKLTWRRIASGLFQPLGVKYSGGKVYVTCRDQLAVLHDLNGDDEIDHFESFNNDHQVTDHFHEFAMGLQVDDEGNFYYAKSARHALTAIVPHHGTLLRISKDGSRTDILATGFRAANGVCLNPDGTFIVTDQEGHWNPKNRINYVKIGGFYGNMFGYHDVTDSSDDAMEQPLCWITNAFDRSPAELLWVDSERWGPLKGQLLSLSYGYGEVYVVPHEKIGGQPQGGMCSFPIGRLPTGIIRGRFHPGDGQLYLCGMFAWSSSQSQPGGLYRLRYTGKPVHLPIGLNATRKGITIAFSGELDPESASDVANYNVKVWDLKRTANYGSKHYDEHSIEIVSARIDPDRRTVRLAIPEIQPTWGMEIRYRLRSAEGKPIDGKIHNTIHTLGEP